MCAICGTLDLGAAPATTDELLPRMAAALRHRGPDSAGFFSHGEISLGHARLSIIDLAGGAQPMSNHDRSVWITFNGEIFNYVELREELLRKGRRFATASDTEVILHLYEEEGERCVERLNGQWAFAIWDARRKKLFLSRDRMGVRPLFYTTAGGRFLFASEIKAFRACPDVSFEFDLRALDEIFTFWSALPPHTAFRNIFQLPPGHSMAIENGQIRIWPYWRLEFHEEEPASEEQAAEELLALLTDATRIRLRADVPVGAYLSGGLDSTFITALVKRLAGDNLRTFSVAFDDGAFDESPYQAEASAFLHTRHSAVDCTPSVISRVFPDVVWHAETPILRTAPAPLFLLSKLVRDSGFKVVLTGEGADEILGGYDIFKEVKIREFCRRNPDSAWRPLLLRRLYPYLPAIQEQPAGHLARFFQVDGTAPGPLASHMPRWRMTAGIKNLFSASAQAQLLSRAIFSDILNRLTESYAAWKPFIQAQYLEANCLLPGYILSSQGDRMAMAHSVEGRFPFLDPRVVEFAAHLPVRLKMKVLCEKYLLRRCADGLIPASIRDRTKQPYRAPDGQCFLDPALDYVNDLLSPDGIRRYGVFDPGAVGRLLAKFRAGKAIGARDNMALVGVVSTQLLAHQFLHSPKGPPSNADSRRTEAVRH